MNILSQIYRPSLSLLTDLYQLTMAYGFWKSGLARRETVFNLFFRKNPFQGGYAVAAGLEYAVSFMEDYGFSEEDLDFLKTLNGNDGKALFEEGFMDFLRGSKFECDIDAMPEGSLVFPHEPMIRVRGPLYQCQLLETTLLNIVNFQTLIATKASRVVRAAQGDSVMEFGLRRAQGIDGGLSATRAAYIGGCSSTSNVLAGRLFGIPVRGTHAHSWVMAFDTEKEAFQKYAESMPNNCIFLVDTYDTVEGVKNAVEVGKWLRTQGHEMLGIRLDSGDLVALSIEARKIMDEAGFPNAIVVASNDLEDLMIEEMKAKGARIDVWGVGTKLSTAYEQAALGGVYKLSAIRAEDGEWDFKVKLSEDLIKVSNPGLLQVRRFRSGGKFVADMLFNEDQEGITQKIYDPMGKPDGGEAGPWPLPAHDAWEDLLLPVFRRGERVRENPDIHSIRVFALAELENLPSEYQRLKGAGSYPVGLEETLYHLKNDLIQKAKGA